MRVKFLRAVVSIPDYTNQTDKNGQKDKQKALEAASSGTDPTGDEATCESESVDKENESADRSSNDASDNGSNDSPAEKSDQSANRETTEATIPKTEAEKNSDSNDSQL